MRLKNWSWICLVALGLTSFAQAQEPGTLYYCGEAGDAEIFVELDRFDDQRARYYVTIPGGYGDGPTVTDLTAASEAEGKVFVGDQIRLSLDAHRTTLTDHTKTYECTLEVAARPVQTHSLSQDDLVGTWRVALFFSPNAAPSETVMEITDVSDAGLLTGSFYQSAFEAGRATKRDGTIVIAMTTRDGSGLYGTSGRLVAPDRIEGQTLSVGRDFLMAWSAEKE